MANRDSDNRQSEALSAGKKRWVSAFVLFHLTAIFVAPWSSPPPASQLSQTVAGFFRPYLKTVAMDNGYRYFAPDPGPSHLVRYEITTRDGEVVRGQFPKRGELWPRLFYHRHFMLSEMVFMLTAPTKDVPPMNVLTTAQQLELERQRQISTELQQSFARHLLSRHDGIRIRLTAVVHAIPPPSELQRGMKLDDPSLYREMPLGEFTEDQL